MLVPSRPFSVTGLIPPAKGEEAGRILGQASFFSLGRHALLHGMILLGLKPGDAIVVPAYCCESALQYVVAHGFVPIYLDVADDLQIPIDALKVIFSTQKVRALLLIHFFGFTPTSRDRVVSLCREAEVKVIEDCCHSFLSHLDARASALEADAYVFSIRKTLPVADGGALILGKSHGDKAAQQLPPPFSRADILFLAMRMIEAAVVKLGWPNLYGPWISGLKGVFRRPGGVPERSVICDSPDKLAISPSGNLVRFLRNEAYLRHIASLRVANYQKLARIVTSIGLKAIIPEVHGGNVPQVFPMLDATGTLVSYLRNRGVGAYRWPGEELPTEVRSRPEVYPKAVRMNESIACLPVHQDIKDAHIDYMAMAIADWKRGLL